MRTPLGGELTGTEALLPKIKSKELCPSWTGCGEGGTTIAGGLGDSLGSADSSGKGDADPKGSVLALCVGAGETLADGSGCASACGRGSAINTDAAIAVVPNAANANAATRSRPRIKRSAGPPG
ncbi:MAG TPA: hypothetical protein VEJ41_04820 [Candidatus Acidoferrales bacterium]|nr:hypothetical protein [Candidatus Acidoferrales bacterium]